MPAVLVASSGIFIRAAFMRRTFAALIVTTVIFRVFAAAILRPRRFVAFAAASDNIERYCDEHKTYQKYRKNFLHLSSQGQLWGVPLFLVLSLRTFWFQQVETSS